MPYTLDKEKVEAAARKDAEKFNTKNNLTEGQVSNLTQSILTTYKPGFRVFSELIAPTLDAALEALIKQDARDRLIQDDENYEKHPVSILTRSVIESINKLKQ